jgi:hypothetical protein
MQHKAHIAHHVKGRLRVRVPSAKGNPKALERIRQSLLPLAGVSEVSVSPSIGTITVNYDPKRHADFRKHLAGEGHHKSQLAIVNPPKLSEIDEVAETLEKEAEYLSSHSRTAKMVFDFVRSCDLQLKRATDNQIDLKVLAPLGLAVYAFVEMGIEAATPVWLTLGLFSFNHFVDLHTHHEAKASAPRRPVKSI